MPITSSYVALIGIFLQYEVTSRNKLLRDVVGEDGRAVKRAYLLS